MGSLRLSSVNLVVDDVEGAATFLEELGVAFDAMPPEWSAWSPHHQNVDTVAEGFDAELDSRGFAGWWGGVPDDLAPGVVVNLSVDDRADVDRLHAEALGLGAEELKAPWDAFWGSRYSVVRAPGPLCVGFMSPNSDEHRAAPPTVDEFT